MVNISCHALVRYIERQYKNNFREECSIRWKFYKHHIELSDSILLKYIRKFYNEYVITAEDDLKYYLTSKEETFISDEMQFVIRDNKLITVFEI